MVDGGGVAGSGKGGTTTSEHLPAIKPSSCAPHFLLCVLIRKHPLRKRKQNISFKDHFSPRAFKILALNAGLAKLWFHRYSLIKDTFLLLNSQLCVF